MSNLRLSNAPTNKKTLRRICIALAALLLLFALCMLALPFFVVYFTAYGHVEYMGYATEEYPMQAIYTPDEFGLETLDQYLSTKDGFRIFISETPVQSPRAIVIYLSGIKQPSVSYFYGHAKWMQENGIASILLEVRGHGKSDGERIALGFEEHLDVEAVLDYISTKEEYAGVPVVLHGVSMGGSVAINAFGKFPQIDGLISMSPYSSFEDVALETMQQMGLPTFIRAMQRPLLGLALRAFYGENAREMVPLEQIKNIGSRPAYLIACTGDTEVPPENMFRLLEKAPDHVEHWLKDSWEHFIVQDCDFKNMQQDTEYCENILAFINRVIDQE